MVTDTQKLALYKEWVEVLRAKVKIVDRQLELLKIAKEHGIDLTE